MLWAAEGTDKMKRTGAGGMKAVSTSRGRADGWCAAGTGHESQFPIASRTLPLQLLTPSTV